MQPRRLLLATTFALWMSLAFLVGLPMTQAAATVRYVATTGNDAGNDCANPASPCASVQRVVDAASEGDEIRIAAGTYSGVLARGDWRQVVFINKTVTLRGGYTEEDWQNPDPVAHVTTLDAQGGGRVIMITGPFAPRIEGLHITGGNATGQGGEPGGSVVIDTGGGIHSEYASVIVRDCAITGNIASHSGYGRGGGLHVRFGQLTLEDSLVQGNTGSDAVGGNGGGLYLAHSEATLTGNTVISNTASVGDSGLGGGLALYRSRATLTANRLQGNVASMLDGGGGGALSLTESTATLTRNFIAGNVATLGGEGRGGALRLWDADVTLIANAITGNTASVAGPGRGGALAMSSDEGRAVLAGNTLIGNTASAHDTGLGGALYVSMGYAQLDNNIIAANRAGPSGEGGALYAGLPWPDRPWSAVVTMAHNTLADNGQEAIVAGIATRITLTNTILSGLVTGIRTKAHNAQVVADYTLWDKGVAIADTTGTVTTTHDIVGNPAFLNPASFNYHITYGSAAIDAGQDVGSTADIDGDPRPDGLRPDIGADEFAGHCATIEGWVFVDANQNGVYDEWWQGQRQGIGDVLITLNDGRTARTSVDGWYYFPVVPGVVYTVTETQPLGWVSTSPDVVVLANVTACERYIDYSFGEVVLPTATPTPTPTVPLTPLPTPTATPESVCARVTEIPQSECEALAALYASTNGPHWGNRTGWLATVNPCHWYGVSCHEGHVGQLHLPNNGLVGTLPPALGDLSRLWELSLDANALTGSIPPELGNLRGLGWLNLSSNSLAGSIPATFGNLTNLARFYLTDNLLTGPLPPELGNMASLQMLVLYRNQLTGTIPAELGNLTQLQWLGLQLNQLTGAIPPQLGNLANLFNLGLSDNQLTGGVPPELGNLSNLWYLWIQNNPLSGPLPRELMQLGALTILYYDHTGLCEPGDEAFQNWLASVGDVGRTGVICDSETPTPTVTPIPSATPVPSRSYLPLLVK